VVKQQRYEPPAKPPTGPVDINTMTDPEAKAKAAINLAAYAGLLGKDARRFRDDGIRGMKAAHIPMPEIARRLGVSLGTVKAACR
jgi:hypothetical protein